MSNSREAQDNRTLQDQMHGHAGELANNTMKPFPGQLDAVDLLIKGAYRIAELEAERDALVKELRRCAVFIRTRGKMHPIGVEVFDELLERYQNNEWWAKQKRGF